MSFLWAIATALVGLIVVSVLIAVCHMSSRHLRCHSSFSRLAYAVAVVGCFSLSSPCGMRMT